MNFIRRAIVPAALLAALLSCDSPTASDPEPALVQAAAGTPQTGVTEDPLLQELVARVTDARGRPVAGVAVAWAVDAGGGSLSAASTATDTAGRARVQWTLGPAPGTFTATATVQGIAPVTFTATAAWPAPAQVQVLAGNAQDGAPAGRLADSLAVKVTSAKGRPVPQAPVSWSVASGGGVLSTASGVTDAAGVARVAWTLGTPGPNAATATVGGLPPVTFAAYAVPVASVTLSAATVRVGRGDATQLVATPRDSTGAPLAGRTVTWTSSSDATAAVNTAGLVTGMALGTATVTAASEGKSAIAAVTVTTEDRTEPRLAGLAFSPGEVDVTSAPAVVQFSVHATDAGSGVDFFAVGFAGPMPGSGASCWGPVSGNGVLASGTPTDGVWTCTATIPRGAAAGTWVIPQLNLGDGAGNQAIITTGELSAVGLPYTIRVINTAPPATPPSLTGLSFTPDPVNVGAGAASVQIAFTATASAGVRDAYVNMESTRGALHLSCTATTRIAGTATAGTWTCSITIPRDAPGGTWQVNTLSVVDSAGNAATYTPTLLTSRGLPNSFQVISPNEDLTAPALTGLTVDPAAVNVADGEKYVRVTVTATDAGTGVTEAGASLLPPSGNGYACGVNPLGNVPQSAVTLACSIPVSANGVEGKWRLEVLVRDAVGNLRIYTSAQLRDAGLPYEVTVTR
jgi:adhesin/invasin